MKITNTINLKSTNLTRNMYNSGELFGRINIYATYHIQLSLSGSSRSMNYMEVKPMTSFLPKIQMI